MSEKKMGPREAQLREWRENRVKENKQLIDRAALTKVKAKAVGGKLTNMKAGKRGGRGK
jgi:hypothetical protein